MPFKPDLQRFLDRLLSRSVLTKNEQDAILDLRCHAAEIEANHDFVGLGERVDHASLIVEGLVGRFDQNGEGSRQITAIHLPGDMANLHSVVQPQSTSALQALSAGTVLRIPHSAIRSATARYPALAEVLWRDSMVDATILSQWVLNVGRRDALSRIAHLFCEIATRLSAPLEKGRFTFPFSVTQTNIANAIGLTTVHVNRIVRSLRSRGLADLQRHKVEVLDWQDLMKAGDFEPDYLQNDMRPEERLRILPIV